MSEQTNASEVAADTDEEMPAARILAAVGRALSRVLPKLIVPGLLLAVIYTLVDESRRGAVGAFLGAHIGFIIWPILVAAFCIWRMYEAKTRRAVLFAPRSTKRTTVKPLMQPITKAFADWIDILIFRDTKVWRVIYLLTTAVVAAALVIRPWSFDDTASLMNNSASAPPAGGLVLAVVGPLLWFIFVSARIGKIAKERAEVIVGIHNVAASTLSYPKPTQRADAENITLNNPYSAVVVSEWSTLTLPRKFFVMAPRTLSVTDGKPWNEFESNLTAKVTNEEGWHVEKDRAGRGATVKPADYPRAVLWDGQQDPEPLTFILGADLDDPGTMLLFTMGEVTPHILITGGTGSGKTSAAEAIMAQAATKPMPWDETLFATCDIIDPKGPFANRWQDRPNIKVTNGTRDIEVDGMTESGIVAMAVHMEAIFEAMNARQAVLDKYPNVAQWLHLPDAEKVSQRMAPRIVVMDEYLDHVAPAPGRSEQVEKENAARERITHVTNLIARKGRSLGFHLIVIAQDARMTDIGAPLVRQLVARIVMGNMDGHANGRMFGNDAIIPVLPTARIVNGKSKTIPGRGRIMNAPGQPLHRVQAYWFGGPQNDETLEKYLPRHGAAQAPIEAQAPDLEDADGNGIPDAWERAAEENAAASAAAEAEEQLRLHPGPAPATGDSMPPPLDGFTIDDLAAIRAEASGAAKPAAPVPLTAPAPTAAPPTAAFVPKRRKKSEPEPARAIDPDDDPDDPEPLEPFAHDAEDEMRVVHLTPPEAPKPMPTFSPLVARDDDLANPADFFGGGK